MNKIKNLILFLLFGINIQFIVAQPLMFYDAPITIHVETAGTLPKLIAANRKYQITSLKLTGKLNGTDIKFLREMAGGTPWWTRDKTWGNTKDYDYRDSQARLEMLDIQEVDIVSGGDYYYIYKEKYSSNEHDNRNIVENYGTMNNVISDLMFYDCKKLKFILLPMNVTRIGKSAFLGTKIEQIHIPKNVTSIGDYAFGTSVLHIRVNSSTPPTISINTFKNVNKQTCKIYTPQGSRDTYWMTWGFDNIVER